jgi:TPR repeat protein
VERVDGTIDWKRAKKMAADVRQRCLSGTFEACAFAGDLENLSKSGRRSSSTATPATTWYELGCQSGDSYACLRLGLASESGDRHFEKRLVASGLERHACELREPAACFNAAAMFMEQGSLAEAENWYWRACRARLGQACRALGDIADQGGRGREAGALYWQGCQSEDARSCAHLGERYLTGVGGELDRERGLKLLHRACDGRDSLGCKRLEQVTF